MYFHGFGDLLLNVSPCNFMGKLLHRLRRRFTFNWLFFLRRPHLSWRIRSWILKHQVIAGSNVRLRKTCQIVNSQCDPSAIVLGDNVVIDGQLTVMNYGGKIRIGSNVFIGEGSRIWSGSRVEIGDRVLISYGVSILDSAFHEVSAKSRHIQFQNLFVEPVNIDAIHHALCNQSIPICIEDDAWIGFGAIILKGVRIGRGAIVAAGSIVTKDVAPFTIVGGHTTRLIGKASK